MKSQKKQKNSENGDEPIITAENYQNVKNTEKDVKKKFTSFSNTRKCIGCNQLIDRKKLIRILKCHKTQQIILQPDNKTFGRSAYLCYSGTCLKEALKRKRLQKNFKKEISEELIKDLNTLIQQY